jgi:hypothetical protein
MRTLSFCAAALFTFLYSLAADAAPAAKIYQIDKAYKVVIISGQIQDKLAVGDRVYVKTKSGGIELVVTMPMMSVAKCRIPSNNNQSDFGRLEVGQEVFFGRIAPSSPAVPASALAGEWTEYWQTGSPLPSYNDIYELDLESNYPVRLRGADDSIVREFSYSNGVLTFVQHTSFDVKYSLKLLADGSALEGTALTPDGSRSVRWVRSAKRTAPAGDASIDGRWKEFWAPGQETDVTYHDIYLVSTAGGLSVSLEKDGGNLSNLSYADGWLSFTQKTAFDVNYRLKLSADGKTLEGTAVTPNKTVPIRWEKQ